MVNTLLLEKKIEQSGKLKKYLANKCGISIQSFRLKCINKSIFNTNQVDVLCDELSIKTLREKESIFFAKNVDKTPTEERGYR